MSLSRKELTRVVVDTWRASDTIGDMDIADQYFLVKNSEIQEKRRAFEGKNGREQNRTLSNTQIPSGYYRNAVVQKVNYAFGKPFSLVVETIDKTAEENEQNDEAKEYQRYWDNYISPSFFNVVSGIAEDSVSKGIGWGYVWINDTGDLEIVDVEPQTVYPLWKNASHTRMTHLVRDYIKEEYEITGLTQIKKVELWDANTVSRFIDGTDGLAPDNTLNDQGEMSTHMSDGVGWGEIPFIPLKGNKDELPLINCVKAQIDAYDSLNSKSVDALEDGIDDILVLKGFSSQLGDLIAQRERAAHSLVIGLPEDGDVDTIKSEVNIKAFQEKLEHLKKEIREFSASVDTQDIRFQSNPSGVALRSMYQDLDTYTNGLEKEFRVFMERFKLFFDKWLEFNGIGNVEKWSKYRVTATLNRDMMINESLVIQDLAILEGKVSQKTLDEWNPAVKSPELEDARRKKEREDMADWEIAQDGYAFPDSHEQQTVAPRKTIDTYETFGK